MNKQFNINYTNSEKMFKNGQKGDNYEKKSICRGIK